MDKLLEAIAGNIIVIAAFMVPVAITAVTSYFSHKRLEMIHRERIAAIEKGMMPPGELVDPDKEERQKSEGEKAPPDYLRTGLFWFCPGAGMVAFCLVAMQDIMAAIRLPILGVSVVCAGVGAAYLAIYFVDQERKRPGLQ
jgi:Domain of unknown function (DUF6249)